MKLATQILMLAATAGLAVLAVNTRKPAEPKQEEPKPPSAAAEAETEIDSWFV